MRISDIKQQQKQSGRYSIYVDGKYVFSLSTDELLSQGIKIGNDYDQNSIKKFQQIAKLDKAYFSAIGLISRRRRSVWEVEQYLKRKGHIDITEKIVNKLSKNNYLDDKQFANSWVENRRLLKNVSRRRLEAEVRAKRVSIVIIKDVLNADKVDEVEVIKKLIVKKRTQSRYSNKEKLIGFLARQGFNYQDISTAISWLGDERNQE